MFVKVTASQTAESEPLPHFSGQAPDQRPLSWRVVFVYQSLYVLIIMEEEIKRGASFFYQPHTNYGLYVVWCSFQIGVGRSVKI